MLSFTTISLFPLLGLQTGDSPKAVDESKYDFWMRAAVSAELQSDEAK
ncbi:MAG: hypothetical protein VXZ82_04500 [Planctomycetota bacterium]|nr:hypothetical protein [Planctomycetota bacterium]